MEGETVKGLNHKKSQSNASNTITTSTNNRRSLNSLADADKLIEPNIINQISNPDIEKENLLQPAKKPTDIKSLPELENEIADQLKDFNLYATKKSLAQGLLDIALLTANITQLKHLLFIGEDNHPFYYLLVIMIGFSLALQV